jgi:hypothetical protein
MCFVDLAVPCQGEDAVTTLWVEGEEALPHQNQCRIAVGHAPSGFEDLLDDR